MFLNKQKVNCIYLSDILLERIKHQEMVWMALKMNKVGSLGKWLGSMIGCTLDQIRINLCKVFGLLNAYADMSGF